MPIAVALWLMVRKQSASLDQTLSRNALFLALMGLSASVALLAIAVALWFMD